VAQQYFLEARDIPADWWSLFHSDALNALIGEALAASPSIGAAEAALRGARETVLAQQGAFFPSVDAQLNPTRQSVASVLSSPLASGSNIYTLHTAQLNISYAPDVFGGNRRQVESLQAQADAQRFQLEAAHLTLTSNVVIAAIQTASLRTQIRTTHDLIALATRQLELFRRQQALGQIGAADVAAQEAAIAQVRTTLPPLEKQLEQQRNQLAVLVGRVPSEGPTLDVELDALRLPEELPLSLPSRLVEQRPDIKAAEEQLHAASAQIGVALANRLPNLSLTASAGSSGLEFSKLFTAGTGFWSLGVNALQPLFDGGTLLHRQRAAQASYDQAAATYRSTVLGAFQNVADTLSAILADARALDAVVMSERAAERSLLIARKQWAAGATSSLAVLSAEQAYRQAALARVQAQANRLTDTVALFQALGGGWWNRGSAAGMANRAANTLVARS
jgi:NodT family efflux transporter outer membrane factor (OMF) lipoprotein